MNLWTGTTSSPPRNDELERLALIGAVAAAGVAVIVLLAGQLAAWFATRRWPALPAGDIPARLGTWAAHLSDPGRAWATVDAQHRGAGPVLWWTTFTLLVAALAGLALGATRRYAAPTQGWASTWAVRRLRSRPGRGRLVIGTHQRRPVAMEARHSLLVLGPTQSGKTSGLAIPAILEWPGPVVATSTKADLIADTIGWRSHLGAVHVFDPTAVTSYPASQWTPLAGCDTWPGATRGAWELAMAGKASFGGSMSLADFWFTGAAKALAPYLYAGAITGRSIRDVARWIDRQDQHDVGLVIASEVDAANAHAATFRRDDRARSSLFQVMEQILGVYLDPTVARSSTRSDFDTTVLVNTTSTLYLTAPARDQERLRPLFATVLTQLLDAAYRQHAATGKPLDPPLLMVIDEAANIAPIDDLPTVASTAAATGVQLAAVFQDLAQIKSRYGQASGTVLNNHRAKLVLPGVSDLDTLDTTSRLIGDEEIDRRTTTIDALGRRSHTDATQRRRLLPAELARQLNDGDGVLLYGNLPPIRLRLRPWYRHRALRRRAATTAEMRSSSDVVVADNAAAADESRPATAFAAAYQRARGREE